MNVKTMIIGCGLSLLCGYAPLAAHAQTGGAGQSGTSGGRQGRGGSRGSARSQGSGMGSGRMSGGMMDDSSGFASFYTGLDQMGQQNLQMIFAENRYRVYPNEEDPVRIDPAPWNYPSAAPGAIDTYHYTDYTHDHLAVGSVTDSRIEKMRILYAYDQMQRRRSAAMRRSMSGGTSGMSGSMGGSR